MATATETAAGTATDINNSCIGKDRRVGDLTILLERLAVRMCEGAIFDAYYLSILDMNAID